MDDDYVCTLDQETLEIAKNDLHEIPSDHAGTLAKFRELIKEKPWIKTPMDSRFLIQFLRVRKFSQLEAIASLEKYWTLRSEVPAWYGNMDTTDPILKKALDLQIYVALPGYDNKGRKVMMFRPGCFNLKTIKMTSATLIKLNACLFDMFIRDEKTQVNGIVLLMDCTGFTLKHQLFWGLDNLKKSLEGWTKAYPMRFKMFLHYNDDPIYKALVGLVLHLFSKKLQSRMVFFGKSMVPIYEAVPKTILPDEYLPDDYSGERAGSLHVLMGDMYRRMVESKAYIADLSGGAYGIDSRLKPKAPIQQASFRYIAQ